MENEIPRVIHQTWKTTVVPNWAKDYYASWLTYNPTWTQKLWTDDECRQFIAVYEPKYLSLYDSFPKHIMRVDFVRYAWLFHLGGLYVDLDFECFGSFESLRKPPCQLMLGKSVHGVLSNSIMMSIPKHPFWQKVMSEIHIRAKNLQGIRWSPSMDVLNTTGPNVVHAVAKQCGYLNKLTRPNTVIIPPARTFFPYSCFEFWKKNQKHFPSDVLACHRHQTTWAPHVKYARMAGIYAVVIILFVVIIVVVCKMYKRYQQ